MSLIIYNNQIHCIVILLYFEKNIFIFIKTHIKHYLFAFAISNSINSNRLELAGLNKMAPT